MSKTPMIYTISWSDILIVAQFRAREGDLDVWAWFYKTVEKLDLPLTMTTKPDDPELVSRSPCIARICEELPPEVRETLNMSWYEFEFRREFAHESDINRISYLYQWYQVLHKHDVNWWGRRVCNLAKGWELNDVRLPDKALRPIPEYVKI